MTGAIAFHVGRSGEVAGGMAQVLNGYRSWPFEEFDVEIIESRDGSRGFAGLRLAATAVAKICRLKARKRDVVVVHLSEKGSFVREGVLLMLARIRGFGTVAHLHGSAFVAFSDRFPLLVGTVLRSAHAVVALSEESATTASRFVGQDRVILVPNAVVPGTSGEKEKLVVFGGAVCRRKGVDLLLEAWRILSKQGSCAGWRLLIAGPLSDESLNEDLRQTDARVELLGPVSHERLLSLLDRSQIAVLPSRDEAMPVFILEAMARNNCIVASDVGGIPAMLDHGAGIVVRSNDVAGLVAALAHAMADDCERALTADRASAAVRDRFAASVVYPILENVWRSARDDAGSDGKGRSRRSGRERPSAG